MPTTTIDINALASRFAEAVSLAEAGTEVVVTENDVPRAKLLAVAVPTGKPRILGMHPGAMIMADDFDDPLPDSFWLGE